MQLVGRDVAAVRGMCVMLAGKTALVTGGALGIGLGVTRKLVAAGAKVTVADLKRGNLDQSGVSPDSITFFEGDMTDESGVRAAIAFAVQTFGPLDYVVCNVGGPAGALGKVVESRVEDFDDALRLTMRSAFLGLKHAGAYFIQAQRSGAITTIGSISAQAAGAGPSIYSAAKAGVVRLTLNAAGELAGKNIRVNCISPGLILTELMRSAGVDESVTSKFQPLPMAGLPEHVGDAAVFLASDAASFISGADLVVDGAALAEGVGLYKKLGF